MGQNKTKHFGEGINFQFCTTVFHTKTIEEMKLFTIVKKNEKSLRYILFVVVLEVIKLVCYLGQSYVIVAQVRQSGQWESCKK